MSSPHGRGGRQPLKVVAGRAGSAHDSEVDQELQKLAMTVERIKPTLDNIGAVLSRLDTTLVRLDSRMVSVETGQAALTEGVKSLGGRVGAAETALSGVVRDAVSRVPTWWQTPLNFFGLISAGGTAFLVLWTLFVWLQRNGYIVLSGPVAGP
jgi:hypothetical protein